MRIDEMQAGREMDCLIAEYVFEWGKDTPFNVSNNHGYYQSKKLLHYSIDIAAAWKVWEWLKVQTHEINFTYCQGVYYLTVFDGNGNCLFGTDAETYPLAICRAALKAVTGREELNG